MWANAQRDGRPAEHRWRLCSTPQIWLTPTTRCRAVTLPRRETTWNLLGCPKLANRSQPLVGRSSPYYEDMCRTYRCLTCFFPIVDMCLSCEDIPWQSCAMEPRWRLFGDFLGPAFPASREQHVSDLHSKCTLECGPMPSVMAAQRNIAGALYWMLLQSLADAHCSSAV